MTEQATEVESRQLSKFVDTYRLYIDGRWVEPEDGRYDDTIRYASDYLRDVEHGAAIQFSKLITYDARYYRGTDAGVFYEAYGPIAAGIGGYPILASPHYHETHDVLETISPHLIAEIARTSVASPP